MKLPKLFASARGIEFFEGPQRCFYCGENCGEMESAETWVKATCTVRQFVAAPGSKFVCSGCAASMQEKATVNVFGENEPRTNKKIRSFSWIVTKENATALTKAHIAELRRVCLDPPEPPFGIVLAVGGQKHLIYLGDVSDSRETVSLLLEDERITYRVEDLRDRLRLAVRIASATGKVALRERPGFWLFRSCFDAFGDFADAESWLNVWAQPLSRLAAFLCPKKEDCNGCAV